MSERLKNRPRQKDEPEQESLLIEFNKERELKLAVELDKLRSNPGGRIIEEVPIPKTGIDPYGPPDAVESRVAKWLRNL